MPLEVANFINQLVPANPAGTDGKNQGDDHLRLIKQVLQNTFPGVGAALTFGGWHAKFDAVASKAGNYNLDATDDGKLLSFTLAAAGTLNLLAASTAGDGFVVFVVKDGGLFDLTIDPSGAELVNGQSTITIGTNEGGMLYCTGTAWLWVGMASSLPTSTRRIRRQTNDATALAGLSLQRIRTGSPAANDLGVTIEAQHKDSAGNNDIVGNIGWQMTNITNGAEAMRWYFESMVGGVIATADRWWKGQGLYADGLLDPGQGGVNARSVQQNSTVIFPRGYIDGLILSNNAVDAVNDIDISTGCGADDANVAMLVLGTALTKRLDAGWAVGTNQGGLDTGAKAANTWYHMWIIRRPDTGVTDILFSTSVSSPTMPANYTQKRRIGAIFTDGTSTIKPFSQFGDEFLWKTTTLPVNVTNLGTTPTNFTLTVPTGLKVQAKFNVGLGDVANQAVYIYSPDVTDEAASFTAAPLATIRTGTGFVDVHGPKDIRTNTSAQIRAVSTLANTDIAIASLGWIDPRGRAL